MPRIPSNSKKSKFDILPPEWKDAVDAGSDEDINAAIVGAAKDQEILDRAQEDDEDLASLKDQVKSASAPYRDGKKMNRTKIQYAVFLLKARGKE